jgi:hypothetical protein
MSNHQRKSTTSLARKLLAELDYVVDQFRTGAISEREARNLGDQAFSRFFEGALDNFVTRLTNSKFFRDPTPDPDLGVLPTARSDA